MSDAYKEMTDAAGEDFKELEKLVPPGTPVAPAHGVAAIALSMAMKYHDMAVIKDGAMYNAYKLEGRNMETLNLDMVLETAIKLEMHLLGASDRIAKLIVEAIDFKIEDDKENADDGKELETKA
jgi:hypothetical protein